MAIEKHSVHRALIDELERAFELVTEYYEAVGVQVREDRAEFEQQYFVEGAGVWLAIVQGEAVGCIALRRLDTLPDRGEIKRMYVRASRRGTGIADSLLGALEDYARKHKYEWLYLDTTDSMLAAARFYERNSYQRCERYNQNPQATLFLLKRLSEDA
jgi:GNAT superfamily N-acetyltransferase